MVRIYIEVILSRKNRWPVNCLRIWSEFCKIPSSNGAPINKTILFREAMTFLALSVHRDAVIDFFLLLLYLPIPFNQNFVPKYFANHLHIEVSWLVQSSYICSSIQNKPMIWLLFLFHFTLLKSQSKWQKDKPFLLTHSRHTY